jgi:hypothetical protein
MKPFCLVCAIGTMMLTTTLSAQQNNTQSRNQPQESQQSTLSEHAEECLAELSKVVDLSTDQKQKVHDVYVQNEIAQKATWQKFNRTLLSAVDIEAEMHTTMEARMTDSQKQTFTAARTSQQAKMSAGTDAPSSPRRIRETSGRSEKKQANKGDNWDLTLQGNSENPTRNSSEEPQTSSESYVQTEIIAPMKRIMVSLDMNPEQSDRCESACHAYHSRLNSTWSEINDLRNELVSQKTKTFKSVSKVLTEEQISKLEKHRATALKTGAADSKSGR